MLTTLRRSEGGQIVVNPDFVRSVAADAQDASQSIIVFGKGDYLRVEGIWSDIRDQLNSALSVA